MKICIKCKIEKDNSRFLMKTNNVDNLSNTCKDCHKEYNLTRREMNNKRRRDQRAFARKINDIITEKNEI
jgi:hypothetical protein